MTNEVFDSLNAFRRAFLGELPQQSQGFPQYNILQNSETEYAIELAVAGYSKDDLQVELDDNILHVVGQKLKADPTKYLYHGLTSRSFTRKFTLSDSVNVAGVKLENGILTINLERIIPERKSKVLEIK